MKIDFTETEKLIIDGFTPKQISAQLKDAALRCGVYGEAKDVKDMQKYTLYACTLLDSMGVKEE